MFESLEVTLAAVETARLGKLVEDSPYATARDRVAVSLTLLLCTIKMNEVKPVPASILKQAAGGLLKQLEDSGILTQAHIEETLRWAAAGCPSRVNDALRKELESGD